MVRGNVLSLAAAARAALLLLLFGAAVLPPRAERRLFVAGGGAGTQCALPSQPPYEYLAGRFSRFGLEVNEYPGTGTGRGVQVRTVRDRSAGEQVLDWSDSEIVFAERALERRPDLAAAAAFAATPSRNGGRGQPLTDESLLACYIVLEELDPTDDAFARYLGTLPLRISSALDQTLPPRYYRSVLPRCYAAAIDSTREYVTRQHANCLAALKATTTSSSQPVLPLDRYFRAFAAVRSRSFALDESLFRLGVDRSPDITQRDAATRRVLLPVHDSLNHRRGAKTRIRRLDGDGDGATAAWRLFSDDAYSAGDEVFTSYGDDRGNLDMLLNYGFAVPENGRFAIRFDAEDFLRAAEAANPRVFAAGNVRGLRNRLEKVESSRRSLKPLQDLALFSVDIADGIPRPCEWLRVTLHAFDYVGLALGCTDGEAQRLPQDILLAMLLGRLEELDGAAARLEDVRRARASDGGGRDDEGAEEVWGDQIRTLLSAERRTIETVTSRLKPQ